MNKIAAILISTIMWLLICAAAQASTSNLSVFSDKIIYWLNQKGSMEASREYLDIINAAGQVWNVDPLLLLAITG